ncbi:MAG: GspH/FimT family pseudopilin [Longimicrobiales bacterium]|nr:GspH/FimT family pseudopilin [Longimicrobiales bacterium]
MNARRQGMTAVELMFVLFISAMIVAIATRESSTITDRMAVANARNAVMTTALIARSQAMQQGRPMYLWVRPDSGWVRVGVASDTLVQRVRMSDYNVEMVGNDMDFCYSSKGYAEAGCTSITSPASLGFVRGSQTARIVVMPLGQMWRR